MKGNACINGRLHWKTIPEEEAESLTTSTQLEIFSAIDAHEGQGMATLDILGSFLDIKNDDINIVINLRGLLTELMVKIALQVLKKYLTTTAKKALIHHVRMNKALYGMLKSAVLFYKNLVKDLKWI